MAEKQELALANIKRHMGYKILRHTECHKKIELIWCSDAVVCNLKLFMSKWDRQIDMQTDFEVAHEQVGINNRTNEHPTLIVK